MRGPLHRLLLSSEADADGTTQRWFVYGNYIDEPLMMYVIGLDEDFESKYYYVQDALYSVRALVSAKGWVIEEQAVYNVYGQPTSWVYGDVDADGGLDAADVMAFYQSNGKSECDPSYNWRCDVDNSGQVNSTDIDALLRNWNEPIASNQLSLFTNPHFFQGKRFDALDDGDLELMSWPYRDYSTYLGRWMQVEKLGVVPNANEQVNPFHVVLQYRDGLNLYESVGSNPVNHLDPMGLYQWEAKPSSVIKNFCECLRYLPHFGTCGAGALEMGWCNGVTSKCKIWCLTSVDVPSGKEFECKNKCTAEHAACVARAVLKKCKFKFKISG